MRVEVVRQAGEKTHCIAVYQEPPYRYVDDLDPVYISLNDILVKREDFLNDKAANVYKVTEIVTYDWFGELRANMFCLPLHMDGVHLDEEVMFNCILQYVDDPTRISNQRYCALNTSESLLHYAESVRKPFHLKLGKTEANFGF